MKWPIKRTKIAGQATIRPAVDTAPTAAPAPSPVDEHAAWIAEGETLAALIDRQEQARAAANPDTVHLLRRRAYDASQAEIEAGHRRRMDALREDDAARRHELASAARRRRLETAAIDGEIDYRIAERDEARDRRRQIMTARAAHDPAIAAADMTRDGQRYVRTYTRISLAGAALAAVGLGAAAMTAGLPLPLAVVAGLLGEVVLTLLITQIIGGRAALHARQRLARNGEGTVIAVTAPRWASQLPWWGVGLLLTASVAINVHGALTGVAGTQMLGALGALGAVIAALATGLAWGYSVETSATVGTLLSDHGIQAGLSELDEVAAGSRLRVLHTQTAPADTITVESTTAAPAPAPTREDVLAALAADPTILDAALSASVDDAIAQLAPAPAPVADEDEDGQDVDVEDESSSESDESDEGESLETGAVAIADRPDPLDTGTRRTAERARRNREAIASALADLAATGETPTAAAIARHTGLSDRTVRRHLRHLGQ